MQRPKIYIISILRPPNQNITYILCVIIEKNRKYQSFKNHGGNAEIVKL